MLVYNLCIRMQTKARFCELDLCDSLYDSRFQVFHSLPTAVLAGTAALAGGAALLQWRVRDGGSSALLQHRHSVQRLKLDGAIAEKRKVMVNSVTKNISC